MQKVAIVVCAILLSAVFATSSSAEVMSAQGRSFDTSHQCDAVHPHGYWIVTGERYGRDREIRALSVAFKDPLYFDDMPLLQAMINKDFGFLETMRLVVLSATEFPCRPAH